MLTLIVDADDTLWENNIFYEQCMADFATLMAEQGFSSGEAEETVHEVEIERIPEVGYSPEEFAQSLAIAYGRLCARHDQAARANVIDAALTIGRRVAAYPMVPLEGVEDTLERLSGHCQLILLTKGDQAVQRDKLARSGLGQFFDGVHVVVEKEADVFRDLIETYDLRPERTWMVGNSPRSDINPAVEAGLGAVYVPHPNTWQLEIEQVVESERVTVLRRFSELAAFFLDCGSAGESG